MNSQNGKIVSCQINHCVKNRSVVWESTMSTEKEIEYKSTIMEMRNIIKNQERVIEELMLKVLDIKLKMKK
jgi:hypothetical protein